MRAELPDGRMGVQPRKKELWRKREALTAMQGTGEDAAEEEVETGDRWKHRSG